RQLEELKWQTQQKDEQLSTHHQEKATIFQQQRELLTALNTVEPNTGLLRGEFVPPTLAYLLHRMASNVSNPRYSSIAVFRLEASPASSTPDPVKGIDLATEARSLQAIARRLEQTVPAESWLYYEEAAQNDPVIDGQNYPQGRFTCITSGLSPKAASDYGEMLRSTLADQALELDNGSKLPVVVSVGGAITSPANQLNSRALLQEADAALEHAKRRGRNRFRLVEVKA
ncbi:MAG TPA: diguanylate cyclase, partial [Allocoleopsis sp.]